MKPADVADRIIVPDELMRKWQTIVEILARVSGFTAALIMRVDPPEIEVFVRNDNDDNPFTLGARTPLNTDLFCERAMATRALVYCADALEDPVWLNPIVTVFGFACYYGLPLYSPDDKPFGTICILNRKNTPVTEEASKLIHLFQGLVESDIARLVAITKEMTDSESGRFDAESKYSSIFHQAAVGLARLATDGKLLECNDKFCDIVGYSRKELVSMNFSQIPVESDSVRSGNFLPRLLAGEITTYSSEKHFHHRMGRHVWAQSTISIVRTLRDEPDYLICVLQDFTEKKMLLKHLENSQKLETVGRLVGGIVHEFNNKLATISGKLLLSLQNNGRHMELIEQAQNECYEAAEMTKGLLAYTRNDQSTRRAISLSGYLVDVVTRLRPVIPARIEFCIDIGSDPMIANVDPTQTQQIALNLINNAIDAVEAVRAPRIVVRLTTSAATDQFKQRFPDAKATNVARLEVEDNGVGIDSAEQSKIFDPFYTTKPVNKGTGLGLTIVAGLVQQHHGIVEVESTPNVGTRISVLFPLSDESALEGTPSDAGRQEVEPGKTVLVVDDNKGVLETTSEILEALGYRVLKARNGDEALSVYRATAHIDCVLTDIAMPKMGGVELWKQLRKLDPAVRLVFMTGYNDHFDADMPDCPRLSKPIEIDEMRRTLIALTGP